MIESTPLISVLLPIFNGEKHLKEAIDSILNQSFKDFELLLLVEFGSSDESKSIVRGYKDARIVIIENTEKLGLPASLNVGIKRARGKYIARMDSDDKSFKNRFKLQVDYLEKHEDVDILGANAYINGLFFRKSHLPRNYEEICFLTCFRSCIMHPVVMWRKDLFVKDGLYYNIIPHSEDYDLWIRALPKHKAVNLGKALFAYRMDGTGKGATTNWQIDTYKMRNNMIKQYDVDFDILESFYEISKNEDVFLKKINCMKQLVYKFEGRCVRSVFTKELSRVFAINEKKDYKEFWSFISEFYSDKDKLYVWGVFRMELLKQRIRKFI